MALRLTSEERVCDVHDDRVVTLHVAYMMLWMCSIHTCVSVPIGSWVQNRSCIYTHSISCLPPLTAVQLWRKHRVLGAIHSPLWVQKPRLHWVLVWENGRTGGFFPQLKCPSPRAFTAGFSATEYLGNSDSFVLCGRQRPPISTPECPVPARQATLLPWQPAWYDLVPTH